MDTASPRRTGGDQVEVACACVSRAKVGQSPIIAVPPFFLLFIPSDLVRHSAARVIAAIASNEFSHSTWPQLLPYLIETCTSNDVKHREVGIYIIYAVLEAIAEGFEPHLANLFTTFQLLLVDPESLEVRITAVKAVGVLAQYVDVEDKNDLVRGSGWQFPNDITYVCQRSIQSMLPAVFQVIGQTVESGNESGARQLFDVLETLLILVRG